MNSVFKVCTIQMSQVASSVKNVLVPQLQLLSKIITTPLPTLSTTISFLSTSCTSDMTGQPHCLCKTGHNGRLCNNCSSGYFGSPPTTPCTDCSCNGNIDLTVPGSCDPEMGICLICINNSTGPECEVCESGYFGDATVQNCQLCDCELEGSHSSICNRSNGQCPCLQGVDGLRCDECQVRQQCALDVDNIVLSQPVLIICLSSKSHREP